MQIFKQTKQPTCHQMRQHDVQEVLQGCIRPQLGQRGGGVHHYLAHRAECAELQVAHDAAAANCKKIFIMSLKKYCHLKKKM